MNKYRKKPVIIEAVQYTGNNIEEIKKFCPNCSLLFDDLIIPTLEGRMRASVNDYIIKGVDGEFYPCKPDIFEKTYDVVENE